MPAATLHYNSPATTNSAAHFAASFDAFTPASYLWDFGDGLPVDTAGADHVFSTTGTFHVTMIAWDAAGHAARATASVEVIRPN